MTSVPDDGDGALLALFAAIVAGDAPDAERRLGSSPGLARRPLRVGAARAAPEQHFLAPIRHHVYAGDTALHVAAAAHDRGTAEALVARGADVRARNRRGAEPLHYAADGTPGADRHHGEAQADVVTFLIGAGADPDAMDQSGVAPLHRAVRNRCPEAVEALIASGADPTLPNRRGSTPWQLAVRNTGKSGSGSDAAREAQARIVALLSRFLP